MPALQRSPSFQRANHKLIGSLGMIVLAALLNACGGGIISTHQTFAEIKPKDQLPEREMREMPHNLFVRIENVADAGRSYKNFVRLFVNGKEVAPVENVSNFTANYTFPMRLQQGIYDVEAQYHVVGFWREKVFKIKADEPVKVMPDHRTTLVARLEKNGSGEPVKNSRHFKVTYERTDVAEQQVVADRRLEPTATSRGPIVSRPRTEIQTESAQINGLQPEVPLVAAPPAANGFTILQINTSPSGADVIIDDKYYGQTPLRVTVAANQNHVLQVSHAGHEDLIKVIDGHDLNDQEMTQLLYKLESKANQ